YLKNLAARTTTQLDDFLIEAVRVSVVPMLYFGGAYVAVTSLALSDKVRNIMHIAILVIMTFYVLRIITSAIKYAVYSYIDKKEDAELKKKQVRGILIIVNVIVWALGIVFLLDNMGRDVTAIIAGLGVGGIAIALAAQTILGDLFSYFVIFFDQPFEIGDFIIVDDKNGVVEYVGVKTTRIRTLNGEILVMSNTDLTNSRLHNYKKMLRRRIVFKIGVVYQTSYEQLEAIPGYIKDIITGVEGLTLDRTHFSGYGDSSLDFETVYYVEDPDYNMYMDKQQQIYLALFKKFTDEGIVFAYPTRTLFLTMEEGDRLNLSSISDKGGEATDNRLSSNITE
ncbi:MAG TPA: mechanosensitive ion channel family protein, partial [Flavipsychrobacter sp.]